jgi:hypothetical protein
VEASSTPTEFKDRWRTDLNTRTAVDQTQTEAIVGPLQSISQTTHTQQSTASLPTTPPTPAAGEIKTVRIEPTQFKDRAKTVEETRASTAFDSGWVPYTDYYGTNYQRTFRNQVAPLSDGFTDDTNNGLSFGVNDFARYDGSAVRAAVPEPGVDWVTGETWNWSYTNVQGETIQVWRKLTFSKAAAQLFASTGSTDLVVVRGGDSGNRTIVEPWGKGWSATRVEALS